MEQIIDYYSQFDEWGRLDREPLEFAVNCHYIKQYLPDAGAVLDNGAGPGKYAMELAKLGYRMTLTDLTPRLVDIARLKAEEMQLSGQFDGFHALNATRLDDLKDEQFDAALMLGPLYHLQREEERQAAVRELYRVTKPGGVVFVAFQSRVRMAMTSLMHPASWKPNDTIGGIERLMETGAFNHQDKGRFTGAYYFHIDEVKPFMENGGFATIDLIGSSSVGALLTNEQKQYWIDRGEYDQLVQFLITLAKDPAVLGTSYHLLYIGKKK
ncbi:class I SAM-dependent methyltransferase [Paenibacillus kobensis]|uniref:class I SAM-dependent methyltransferase n=1 Tax=Paenibacillus kobensis TaxID=59841 RepID=UPI000FD8D4E8|nr:class I SAM-dependent methyltransferase [Paenibacillus kobensis]